jgi:hypothetical protein
VEPIRRTLSIGDDQMDIEATAGAYSGERPFGRAANLPSTRPRKPTDADMGPHNCNYGHNCNYAITAITRQLRCGNYGNYGVRELR